MKNSYLLFAISLLAVTACGSDDSGSSNNKLSEDPNGSAGSSNDDGTSGDETEGNEKCSAPTPRTVVDTNGSTRKLQGADDGVYFLDVGPGAVYPNVLRHVTDDGSDEVLYTSPEFDSISRQYSLQDLAVDAESVFFLESNPAESGTFLLRIPRAGGEATRVSEIGFDALAELIGVDETAAYVYSDHTIRRVTLDDGAQTVIADSPTAASMQLFDGAIWYNAFDPNDEGKSGVYRIPVDASGPSAELVGNFGGLAAIGVTSDGIFTSGVRTLQRYGLDGSGPTTVWNPPVGLVDVVTPPDGDFVYLVPYGGPENSTIWKLPTAGGTPSVVTCERFGTASVTFGSQSIYWVEYWKPEGGVIGEWNSTIYALPK